MQTVVTKIAPEEMKSTASLAALSAAAETLQRGALVAFPTETVYGLGANALDSDAVARIFVAKQRPAWDPLIVHIASWPMLDRVVAEISPQARSLMRAFWPGPLTLLLPRSALVPDAVTAGRPLVAVRWPAHPVAQQLILAADLPLAAPSANLFSHVSPTTAAHVLADLDGRIDLVLDAGPTLLGLESAVLDPNTVPPTLYRPGTISLRQMEAIVGPVAMYQPPPKVGEPQALPSPGGDMRHYAPRARVVLLESRDALAAASTELPDGRRIGILLPDQWPSPPHATVFPWGSWNNPAQLASNLYAGLRWLDEEGCDVILCPLPVETHATHALRDRLLKAARDK
jgi:L-threonylcarbamoyladenylate synthase